MELHHLTGFLAFIRNRLESKALVEVLRVMRAQHDTPHAYYGRIVEHGVDKPFSKSLTTVTGRT